MLFALTFTTLGAGAYVGSLYAPNKSYYQTAPKSGAPHDPAETPKNGLVDASGIPGLVERAIAQPHAQDTEERVNRDLAAQEAMATFAFWMFLAVVLQTILAGGALVALIRDLRQNRRSVDAYVQAESSLLAGGAELVGENAARVYFRNIGRTPAFVVHCDIASPEKGQTTMPYPMTPQQHPMGVAVEPGGVYYSNPLRLPDKVKVPIVAAMIFRDNVLGFQVSTVTIEMERLTDTIQLLAGFDFSAWIEMGDKLNKSRKQRNK